MGNEFIPEELNLLSRRPQVSVILGSEIVEYSTLNSVENCNVLEFLSLPHGDRFKCLNYIYLKLKLKIVKNDGSAFTKTDADQPTCVSNLLHSLIKSAYCSFNNVNVISIDDNYAQKEWLETFLSYPEHTSKARLCTQHYFEGDDDAATVKNIISDSKTFELYGRINLFCFEKLLLPNVSVSFKFNLANADFFLQESNSTSGSDSAAVARKPSVLKMLEAKLFIRHVSVSPEYLLGVERAIAQSGKVSYEFDRGVIISQTCPAGLGNIHFPHFYQGLKPKIALFLMCTNVSYVGSRQTSPFSFKHFNLQTFSFILNGSNVPSNAYEFKDTETEKCYSQIYSKVYESMNLHSTDKSIGLSRESFIKDRFMIAHDFTNSGNALSDVVEPMETVSVGISGNFEKPTTEVLTLLLYMMIPTRIDVHANRSVAVAY